MNTVSPQLIRNEYELSFTILIEEIILNKMTPKIKFLNIKLQQDSSFSSIHLLIKREEYTLHSVKIAARTPSLDYFVQYITRIQFLVLQEINMVCLYFSNEHDE